MNPLVSGIRFTLALGLCFAIAAAAPAVAADSAAQAEAAEAKAPALDIAEGRAYGVLDKQPLGQVLDVFARAMDMAYEIAEPLGRQPLSGRLDGLPAGEALVDLLRHFDYTAVWRADGSIERLKVTDLRPAYREVGGGVASDSVPAAPRVQSAAGSVDEDFRPSEIVEVALTEEELREEVQFMDLEALARKTGVPIEDFYNPPPNGGEGEPQLDVGLIDNLLAQIENEKDQ